MADVSHELGALRFVVDSPLSSKVAMFNNQATQHKQSQLLNPFTHDGRATSPKPTFSKDQYGKPLTGSLTEMRGQKANMHVMKEMLELCQIISSEGYQVKDEPTMRVIPFGELFNIYNYISDKVVGLLLRARKHKLLEFEGEMLYQRRDDNVPIFLLRPVSDIRRELNEKIDEIKRGTSPAPQSTSVLLDKSAHEQNLKVLAKSRTPSPAVKSKSKSVSPAPAAAAVTATDQPAASTATIPVATSATAATPTPAAAAAPVVIIEAATPTIELTPVPAATTEQVQPAAESQPAAVPVLEATPVATESTPVAAEATSVAAEAIPVAAEATPVEAEAASVADSVTPKAENIVPVQPVVGASNELPTIVIEATATFVRTVSVENLETSAAAESAAAAESGAAESA